ncbi:MAG: LysM peptidoglycan-binding domain-containing protein [Proteobacteria bacterium]|nr:LysM peptidoglycan-binding domain-containing protein [Pseudomonadota bacterium]
MKNFSTAVGSLALVALLAAPVAQAAKSCEFRSDAPDSHTVVRGDTLWGISGKFLANPWCWPQVWGMNKEQIKNPHWIYPGQTVYLDRANGRLRLGKPTGAMGDGRLSPQIRSEDLGQAAVPAIPANVIEPFLSQPLVVEEQELQGTPHIVAAPESRVVLGTGDKLYVAGDLKGGTAFQVFRPGKALIDPETKGVLGHEAVYLGSVKLQRAAKDPNEAHIFTVTTAKQEMTAGDRLLPMPPTPLLNYVPHAPAQALSGRVVSIYEGVVNAGQNQVITINRGKNAGVDVGTTLSLYRFGRPVVDRVDGNRAVQLPNENYGDLFIFRVFNNISYGLVMRVTNTVQVGDIVQSPQ